MGSRTLIVAAATSIFAAPVSADPPGAPAAGGYTVFNPTPESALRPLCTDRPTKSTAPCTVDPGHWQLETDLYNFTRQSAGGVTVDTQLFTNPTLKLGLTDTWDVEASIAPYEQVTIRTAAAGSAVTAAGVGDLYLRTKVSLLGEGGDGSGGDVGLAVEPYVKLPTAGRRLGNGAVEAGVVAPIQIDLPKSWQLAFDPELDALANAVGPGRHLSAADLVSLSYPVTRTVTLSAELWGELNFDPAGEVTQTSFDLGAAWIPPKAPNVQLDGGVNLGLNRATPGLQAYVGLSRRF